MNRWLAGLVVALAWVLVLTATPTLAAGSPEVAQRDALNRVLAILDSGSGATRNAQARAARDALAVLRGDPDLARQTWLAEPLEGAAPDLARARDRIHAALAALDSPTSEVGDAVTDRQALATILADPRFHPQDLTSYLPAWLVPVAVLLIGVVHAVDQAVSDIINRLFRLLVEFIYSDAFTVIVLGLTAVIVPAIIFLYVRTLRGVLVPQAQLKTEFGAPALTGPELLDTAQGAAIRGEFRAACHYAFLSALRVVEDRIDVRLDYSATNREQLRRLASAPGPLAKRYIDTLKPLIDRFDQVWYGQAVASDGDFQEIYKLAARLSEVGE